MHDAYMIYYYSSLLFHSRNARLEDHHTVSTSDPEVLTTVLYKVQPEAQRTDDV